MIRSIVPIVAIGISALLCLPATVAAQEPMPLSTFLKDDTFTDIKISPTGKYLAATVPVEDKTVLVVLDRATLERTGLFNLRGRTHVVGFWWVNDDRIVMSVGEKQGRLEMPRLTGELYATNADGTRQEVLAGYRAGGATNPVGTRIRGKSNEPIFASLVDTLREDEDDVIVAIHKGGGISSEPVTHAERMNVYSGSRTRITTAPVRRATFTTDHQGQVRFAAGAGTDNLSRLYHRAGDKSEWVLVNDEKSSGRVMTVLGFAADGVTAYIEAEEETGPNAIYAMDTRSGAITLALRDDNTDPLRPLFSLDRRSVIGAAFMDPTLRLEFFDPDDADSRLYRSLAASFGEAAVLIDSATRDGRLAMLYSYDARNPGDYFLFDRDAMKAAHVVASRAWIDPEAMGAVRPVSLKARDGLDLHGYLTFPPGADGSRLPLIVHPHGGPFGPFDRWGFNPEVQLLASRGYAVLQVNFRGSGNYGRSFMRAGYQQWGGTMQDDLTDATRWAIAQGIADPDRICLYGASYGGFASLMGVAKEPDMYRCAVGYVGVYDLPDWAGYSDVAGRLSGTNYIEVAVGTGDHLRKSSPVTYASNVKVPVFLAAGGEDRRCPAVQTESMARALEAAGVPVEKLIYPTEGHGFYHPEHRQEFYTRLLAFLDRNIGQARSTAAN